MSNSRHHRILAGMILLALALSLTAQQKKSADQPAAKEPSPDLAAALAAVNRVQTQLTFDMQQKVREEVQQLRQELRQQLKMEINQDLRRDLKMELKQELRQELKMELKQELRQELKP